MQDTFGHVVDVQNLGIGLLFMKFIVHVIIMHDCNPKLTMKTIPLTKFVFLLNSRMHMKKYPYLELCKHSMLQYFNLKSVLGAVMLLDED